MRMLQRIEKLNYYTKMVVSQPNFTRDVKDDLIYVVSNISIYAIR